MRAGDSDGSFALDFRVFVTPLRQAPFFRSLLHSFLKHWRVRSSELKPTLANAIPRERVLSWGTFYGSTRRVCRVCEQTDRQTHRRADN